MNKIGRSQTMNEWNKMEKVESLVACFYGRVVYNVLGIQFPRAV